MTEAVARKGGPKTEAGKAVSSRNSLKHGLLSPKPVVEGLERKEDWEYFREGILKSLAPMGILEFDLAEQVAALLWRRKRITRYEAEAISISMEEVEEKLGRVEEAEVARQERRLFEWLPLLGDEEPVSGDDATIILFRLERHAGVSLDDLELPGIPEDAPYERLEWTGRKLKEVISALAKGAKVSGESLTRTATRSAIREAEEAERKVTALVFERFPEQLYRNRIFRERILPNEKTLEKVQRYEAHLTRQLNQTLHELEALQARREGGSAPLARLDVQGLPEN